MIHTLKPAPNIKETARSMHLLTVQAISAALTQQWDTAITLNQKILQDDPTDYDALNRLAYAFFELGRIEEAAEMFTKVLALDPKNLIATRNLLKIQQMHGHHAPLPDHHDEERINPQLFVEEPGKTKTTNLIRIAAKDVLSTLRVGFKLELIPKNRAVAVMVNPSVCVGYLPDDLAFLLVRLMNGGNVYDAYIKSVSPNLVSVFIKETKKSDQFHNIPSFMDTKKKGNHVYRPTAAEPPTLTASEEHFDYQDDGEQELFEVE